MSRWTMKVNAIALGRYRDRSGIESEVDAESAERPACRAGRLSLDRKGYRKVVDGAIGPVGHAATVTTRGALSPTAGAAK